MMKKTFLWVLMSLLALPSVLLTSCDDSEEDEFAKEQRETKEVHDKLIQNYNIDMSDAVRGKSTLGKWDLREDSTFTYYYVTNLESDNESNFTYDLDSITGHWQAFSNMENLWDDNDVKLSGFFATFDLDESWGVDGEDDVMTFYIVYQEDGLTITLLRSSIDYIFTYANIDLQTKFLSWGDISDFFTNTLPQAVEDAMSSIADTISKKFNEIKQDFCDLFTLLFGKGVSVYLNTEDSEQYWEYARKCVAELQNGHATDYANWMSEIYAGKESTTRLCEMNIPGSNESFTCHMEGKFSMIFYRDWAQTQYISIVDQWNAGVRCFDVRLGNTYKNVTTTEEYYNQNLLGIFHGRVFCDIDASQAVEELVDQLKAHPKETAIAMCSFEDKPSETTYRLSRELFEDDRFKDYIVLDPKPDMTLADCQGKLVVFQCWDDANDYPQYRIGASIEHCPNEYSKDCKMRFYDTAGNVKTTNCYCQNLCVPDEKKELGESFYNTKKMTMLEYFDDVAATKGSSDNVWCINQVTAYEIGQVYNRSYAKSANHMNPATFFMIYEGYVRKNKLGIVVMDFAGTNLSISTDHPFSDDYYVNGESLPKLVVETNRYQ